MTDADSANALMRSWLILLGLALGVCVTNSFARFAYGLILPAMQTDLGWSYAQAGWLNTANAIGYIVGALTTIWLIRLLAPWRLFLVGFVATTLSLIATGLETGLIWQSTWRIAAGLFGALSFSTAGLLAAQLFPQDPRRAALAVALLFGLGGGFGLALGGASVPLMLDRFGSAAWPWAWVIIGGMSLSFLPVCFWAARALRSPPPDQKARVPLPLRTMWAELAGYGMFGLGYIVYLTFISAWMTAQNASALLVAGVWITLGICTSVAPFVWGRVFARHASGRPLSLVLCTIALGSALPVLMPNAVGLVASAIIFGLSVFMAPGAITSFTRQNLPAASWGQSISVFTAIFAVAQSLSPIAAGWLGDISGDIGFSLLAASTVLLTGAGFAAFQKPLQSPKLENGM
ncbi:YbfB/YjiJ family MFS transporter [Thalassococcus sp. S3]|uniref:YbfB/YjiJ family MFS transporter n=1 Tax=Thalassococcus sp. S3 TaxID=2017482 RepID=UPI0010246427|nr:YbfB/YjiJ family MFS transporter [Thalassococcus sp. S3]QBF33530.1 MFS transporter [Thalassococcus sp. S3]